MRLAILHAPGDEAIAARVRSELVARDALVAPIGSRLAFGAQIVLLVLWTDRAVGLEGAVAQLASDHVSLVVWRCGNALPPPLAERAAVLSPDTTPASLATALRLAEIEGARPRDEPPPRRKLKRRLAATAIGVAIFAAVGAAGAAAVMLENEDPTSIVAERPSPAAPSP